MSSSAGHGPETGPVDPYDLRRCAGRFPTGVTVLTYRGENGPRGATMNSFTSVSLDPPLVLLSLARTSQACRAVADVPFAVNVLRCDQMDVALQFAGRPQSRPVDWARTGDEHGPPALAGTIATITCSPWRRYDGGDHVLQLGLVTRLERSEGEPLVFADGRFMTPGLPLLDGPLIVNLDGPPRPGWTAAAHRLHTQAHTG